MRNGCFPLAVSIIEKQSREQALKQSTDDIKCWYLCDFILTKVFINLGCEMAVGLTNITIITARTNKFINNLSTKNT